MKLKTKNLNWLAGRPVVFLNEETAKKLNVYVNERLLISNGKSNGNKKIYAVVDLFSDIVKKDEIGISKEISKFFDLKSSKLVDVSVAGITLSGKLIKKKISGKELNQKEFDTIIYDIVHNNLTEAEIAYFIASEKLIGLSINEIERLIKSMISTGSRLNFNNKIIADKHCIGGIAGNRTTPIVVSICAEAGLIIPKTSSKAITSASGTADVIETISKIEFNKKELQDIVLKTNASLAWGGGLEIAPSDDKIIYVERILNLDVEPQLIASIISKKIAAGSKYILIDIPYGKSAKVKNIFSAISLGRKFKKIAKRFKLELKVIYSDGKQPIGNGIGPVLEMLDILKVLKNEKDAPEDLRKKSISLSCDLMELTGIKNPKQKVLDILNSGKAYERFKKIINAQNNKNNFEENIQKLELGKIQRTILSKKTGKIIEIDNKKINSLCRILGTPETKSAGVYLYKHLGKVSKGEKVLTLYSESKKKIKEALEFIKKEKPIVVK
jgi:putative thymidine phosphorylase